MSAFSVSDLLNPAPLSHPTSPHGNEADMEEDPSTTIAGDLFAPELFQTDSMDDAPSIFDQQGMIPLDQSSSPEFMRKDSMMTDTLNGMDTLMEDDRDSAEPTRKKERSTKQRDPEKLKDTKHSSKNEGQHTDRRYLCYICHKLFTRRRSVRDHLNKIHGEKTWEPQRSLEVVVEPHSGEPIQSIDDIIARGPPPPTPKPEKSSKSQKENRSGEEEEQEDDDGIGEDTMTQMHEEEEPEESRMDVDMTPSREPEVVSKTKKPAKTSEPEPEPATQPEPEVPVIEEIKPEPAAPKLKKEESQQSESCPASVEPSLPASIIGKKRPLAATKRGTAKHSCAITQRHPGSESRLQAQEAYQSRTCLVTCELKTAIPLASPSVATPASSNDDGEIFCICRKGDNHTWMIACDGPCEEWFHGKCVGIRERDGELIDKYICPNCMKDGFITTWKRMCRRSDCRKPARVKDKPPSKYCSVECGRMFFIELIRRGDPDAQTTKDGQFIVDKEKDKKARKKIRREKALPIQRSGTNTPMIGNSRPHTPAYSEDEKSEYETDSSLDEEELPNRGGPLRAGEVKALLQQCKSIESWRGLGKKPETPPRELDEKVATNLEYDDYEKTRIVDIRNELDALAHTVSILAAREKMLELIKARSATIADEVKKGNPKLKEVCGFDSRIAWCDEEFLLWYNGEGKKTLESGKIGPPDDTHMTNGVDSDDEGKAATMKGGVCIRNRCQKHGKQWQRAQLAELRFEQDLVKKKQGSLAQQDHGIRSRAQIRALESRRPVV